MRRFLRGALACNIIAFLTGIFTIIVISPSDIFEISQERILGVICSLLSSSIIGAFLEYDFNAVLTSKNRRYWCAAIFGAAVLMFSSLIVENGNFLNLTKSAREVYAAMATVGYFMVVYTAFRLWFTGAIVKGM